MTDVINDEKEINQRVYVFPTSVSYTHLDVYKRQAKDGRVVAGEGETSIFIYPGYQFQILSGLITNFHLPKSTLVMLVSALAGREHVLHAYEVAVQERYRFFSFGDAMFIADLEQK